MRIIQYDILGEYIFKIPESGNSITRLSQTENVTGIKYGRMKRPRAACKMIPEG